MNEEKLQTIIQKYDFKPELGYTSRSFISASMPFKQVKGFVYKRTNGDFSLELGTTKEDFLPFGSQPRLLICYFTTQAVRTKNKEIDLGNSLGDFLRSLGFEPSGGRYGSATRVKDAMNRLSRCTIHVEWSKPAIFKNITPLSTGNLGYDWWNVKKADQRFLWSSTITLTQEFFEELITTPVPYAAGTLSLIKHAPMMIDQYLWISYRNSYIRKPTQISWESLHNQFGSSTPNTYRGLLNFKRMFSNSLSTLSTVYPAAGKLKVNPDGLLFIPGEPDIPKLSTK